MASLGRGPPLDKVNIKGARTSVLIRPPHNLDKPTRSDLLSYFYPTLDKTSHPAEMGLGKRQVPSPFGCSRLILRSIRVNGAECGVESILLGVVTSVGGFLFGYDTGQISGMLIFSDFVRLLYARRYHGADH